MYRHSTATIRRLVLLPMLACASALAVAAEGVKPNILVIWGDDIGIPQISAYTRGLMGYQTPNIDRIATSSRRSSSCRRCRG